MTNIFYQLYVFINGHKLLSFALLLAVLFPAVFFASTIKLEENITSVIPKDKNVAEVSSAFEGFKMNNQLVLHLYTTDSAANPQLLMDVAHQLEDSLNSRYSSYITNIKLEFSDNNFEELYSYYTQHLPLYLQDIDYQAIEERTTQKGIATTVEKNYKALMSPMSIVTKKMLVRDPLSLVGMPLQRARSLQMDDNVQLYENHLFTADRQHLIFFISLANPPNESAKNGELLQGIDQLKQQLEEKHKTVQAEYFGSTAVSVANAGRIKSDIILTVTIAVAGLFLFIAFFYRNIGVFFIAITPGIFGALVAVALLAVVKTNVSVISLGVGSILLGITIDYALHFFTHSKHQQDLKKVFADISGPMLMSSATTACAFFSLLFLRSDALADLGFFAGVSVLAAALYTLVVLPHLSFRRSEKQQPEVKKENLVEKIVAAIASYPFNKSKVAIAIFVLLTVVSLFTWRGYSFESDMMRLNYMPEHLARYEQNLNKVSTYSANTVFLLSTGKDLWEALEKETLVQQKLQQMQQDGFIYDYVAVGEIVPPRSLQKQRLNRWSNFWQPAKRDSVLGTFYQQAEQVGFQPAAFAGFEQMLQQQYEPLTEEQAAVLLEMFGEDLIIRKDGKVSVISSVKTSPANKRLVLQAFDKMQGPLIFDKAYFTAKLVELLQEDFNTLVNLSLVVVFLIILICYGRLELALIVFLPILFSWLWILGLMGLLGLSFNIVNIIICTFIFGLGIDYSIFVMRGLTQQYALGLSNIVSYKKSIILSAITTLLSIGVLAFAEHPALQSIALLAIIGISSVIFLTFTLQPILYDVLILNRKRRGVLPFTLMSLLLSFFAFIYFLIGCLLLMLIRLLLLLPVASAGQKKRGFHQIMMLFCRSLIYIMVNVKKQIINREEADFQKPAVIISNHHSFLDIILLLMFSPKVVMVTNDWVYHSPFFGKAVQFADFIPAEKGMESQLPKLQHLVSEGYSIIVFPEGSRSEGFSMSRFHKGAFYLAEYLKLDIQPVLLHGTNYTMPKTDGFHLKSGTVTVKFLPRIAHTDTSFGENYTERTKKISRYFKEEYQQLRTALETPVFFKETVVKNYLYKGPVLEWYVRVKFGLEKGFDLFHQLIPAQGRIVDLGCGYGYLPYSLALSGEKRQILGIDYDEAKINIARNCPVQPANVTFAHGDVTTYSYGEADVFVVSDVLHYLVPEDQLKLLNNMRDMLAPGGRIILRDGDCSKTERHKGTRLTEIFSTKSGFNKTQNQLHFISASMIEQFAADNQLELEIIDNTKLTSNTVFVLKHKGHHGEI